MFLAKLSSWGGWLFFQSNIVKKIYFKTVHSQSRVVQVLGFTFIACVFAARSARQFLVPSRPTLTLAASVVGLYAILGGWALLVTPAAAIGWVAWRISRQPGDGAGHRAGWEGYEGLHCENTVEGLRELAARDNKGQVAGEFPFVEFDVQETKDGQLVVFHDGALERAFPRSGANEQPVQELEQAGINFELASVQDLTAAQLQSLHVAGREGVHVPLLQEFLRACVDAGVRRSLAVEVKVLLTDAGRQQLLDSIRWYLDTHGRQLDESPWRQQKYAPLGWAGVIAFPHFFAKAFGEFGGVQWRRWACEFRRQGVRARACHFHDLTLIGA